MLYALKEFLSVNVHTQSIKIGLEDESKSFFMFSTKLWFTWAGIIYSQVLTNCCIGGKKLETTRSFFSVCAYSEGGNEITCRRSKSKGKKNVRELGQDLQENVPFLRTKCIVGKKVASFTKKDTSGFQMTLCLTRICEKWWDIFCYFSKFVLNLINVE